MPCPFTGQAQAAQAKCAWAGEGDSATEGAGGSNSASKCPYMRCPLMKEIHSKKSDFNFGTTGYFNQFGDLPLADGAQIRADTVEYMSKKFDAKKWTDEPVQTIIGGRTFTSEGAPNIVDTVDAFNRVNGKQILSPPQVVTQVINHVKNYVGPKPGDSNATNLLSAIRRIDKTFMTTLAGEIIGNQSVDFGKQDGITEIEESTEANKVEQRFNDALLKSEAKGEIIIRRDQPIFVGAVSNFSNFLDLCRKCLRHLEVGVPVVVFSRSNTGQHVYRWVLLLLAELEKYGIDKGMVTFCSCSIEEQRRVFRSCPESPMHFTGSREIAEKIKEVVPKLIASTGGPNTLIASKYNPAVGTAVRYSNLIENKGQCTALRHFVCPDMSLDKLNEMYAETDVVDNSLDSIKKSGFACVFKDLNSQPVVEGYEKLGSNNLVKYKLGDDLPKNIQEQWRQIYIDVTKPKDGLSDGFLSELEGWLIKEQPISVAVNSEDYGMAMRIFENTAVVVYTVGDLEKPALTAQARPQDGECFGEFPPRKDMEKISYLPMIIPSPVAAYNSVYSNDYLLTNASRKNLFEDLLCEDSLTCLHSKALSENQQLLGYAVVLLTYLLDAAGATTNPKHRYAGRTVLFGLQRPPIAGGYRNVLHIGNPANGARLMLYLACYMATNASDAVEIIFDKQAFPKGADEEIVQSLPVSMRSKISFQSYGDVEKLRSGDSRVSKIYNIIAVDDAVAYGGNMLAAQFCSRIFPMGHIKSTRKDDTKFVEAFRESSKWLKIRPARA